jgi:hypothetical protein
MTYAGARESAFFTVYSLMRNGIAFLCALTFYRPLASLLSSLITSSYPMPEYFVAFSFGFIFGGVILLGRWLKTRFTYPGVECPKVLNWTLGGAAGLLNAIVITGAVLIGWSIMPFVKYIPRDLGHIQIRPAVLDTGVAMLKTYGFIERRMGGNVPFLVHDEPLASDPNNNGRPDPGEQYEDTNRNGRWDRGWLWKYRHAADILPGDLKPLNLSRPPEP